MKNNKLSSIVKKSAAVIICAVFSAAAPVTVFAKTVSHEVGVSTEWTEGEPIENPTNVKSDPGAELKESVETNISDKADSSYEVSGPIDAQPGEYEESGLFNFDEKVHILKENLMNLGYLQKDVITDVYDPYTQLGVMFFQRDNNLPVTGIADEKTLEAAASADAKPYELRTGAEGEDVRQLQNALQSLGYGVDSTGVYDAATQQTVKKYAQDRNINFDGSNTSSELLKQIYDDSILNGDLTAIRQGVTDSSSSSRAEALIAAAREQLGKPYVLGGKGPDVFDCSGLVYYCLNQSGYDIDYMTSAGWAASSFETIENMSDLVRGDILCFKGHVGIYLGDGLMLDASSSQGKVRISSDIGKTAYWLNNFLYGKRVF